MVEIVNGDGDTTEFNELVQHHVMVRSQLPELLAQLATSGKQSEALNLLIQWGAHDKANSEVWNEAKQLLKGECA